MDVLNQTFFGNTVTGYVIALVTALIGALVVRIVGRFLIQALEKFSAKTSTDIDDLVVELLRNAFYPFAIFLVIYCSLQTLSLHDRLLKLMNYAMLMAIVVCVCRAILALVRHGFRQIEKHQKQTVAVQRSFQAIFKVIQIIVWGMALIFFLDNIGVNISAFVAGLGIGGIAIAFAAQSVLKDLFCYFGIIMDQPFVVGEKITVGDMSGEVTHIGIVSTRIQSGTGELLIFSNADLIGSRIKNFSRMYQRKVVFRLGIEYSTPYEKVEQIPHVIKNIITQQKNVQFGRCHFMEYGDFSLNFETVYMVLSREFDDYAATHHEINLAIMREFEKMGVQFAYPTQTLYVNRVEAPHAHQTQKV